MAAITLPMSTTGSVKIGNSAPEPDSSAMTASTDGISSSGSDNSILVGALGESWAAADGGVSVGEKLSGAAGTVDRDIALIWTGTNAANFECNFFMRLFILVWREAGG